MTSANDRLALGLIKKSSDWSEEGILDRLYGNSICRSADANGGKSDYPPFDGIQFHVDESASV